MITRVLRGDAGGLITDFFTQLLRADNFDLGAPAENFAHDFGGVGIRDRQHQGAVIELFNALLRMPGLAQHIAASLLRKVQLS